MQEINRFIDSMIEECDYLFTILNAESRQENSFEAFLYRAAFFSFLYKLKLSVFQAAAHKNEWKSHSVLWLKGKLTKASENIFFPFFFACELLQIFLQRFFYISADNRRFSFLSCATNSFPSVLTTTIIIYLSNSHERKKIASRQQFFCVLFQFFSYFFFFDTIPSPSIPFSHIIILYSVPFCPFI